MQNFLLSQQIENSNLLMELRLESGYKSSKSVHLCWPDRAQQGKMGWTEGRQSKSFTCKIVIDRLDFITR